MKPTEVDYLMQQSPGVLINTNISEYDAYLQRRKALQIKDGEINELKEKINTLNVQLNKILSLINKQE